MKVSIKTKTLPFNASCIIRHVLVRTVSRPDEACAQDWTS